MLVIVYATVALVAALAATVRRGEFRALSDENRWAGVAVVLVTGWPMMWTFFLGPLIVGSPTSALFPTLWYLPSAGIAVLIMRNAFNTRGFRVDVPVAIIAAVSALAGAGLLLAGSTVSEIQRWVLAAVILAIAAFKRERVTLAALAWGCRMSLLLIASTIVAAVVGVPGAVGACRTDKCGSAGQALTSPFAGNGNVLGLTVALLLPFALVHRRWPAAAALVLSVVALGELAGSRTALLGVAIVVAMTIALRLSNARRTVASLGLGLSLALSLAPVLLSYGDEAFSFRGTLWNEAKLLIGRTIVLGQGPAAWERIGTTSVFDSNYSPHNAWLDMTLSVGVAGVALIVAAVALKAFLLTGEERSTLIVFICGLLGISTLESLLTPYFLGILPCTPVLLLLMGPGRLLTPRRFTSRRAVLRRRRRPLDIDAPVPATTTRGAP
ncbi:O-antigen ligase family protein [Williamsia sp. MIQD14]|uniref:O-antigen ligase family protein n=1 Tax=Williamsia sp. MIQD14 TaxID=3425703 RepID=UPI003DA12401